VGYALKAKRLFSTYKDRQERDNEKEVSVKLLRKLFVVVIGRALTD
jgi:hypothetical protein